MAKEIETVIQIRLCERHNRKRDIWNRITMFKRRLKRATLSSRAKGSTNPMPDDAWPEDAYADNVVGHEEFRMSAS